MGESRLRRHLLSGSAVVGCTLMLCGAIGQGCLVEEHCYDNSDCPAPMRCGATGACEYECSTDADCGAGLQCVDHRCLVKATVPITCPDDMVNVQGAFCVDRYEASRTDATQSDEGKDETRAVSRKGVLPWRVSSNAAARSACLASGRDLCTPMQWQRACEGPEQQVYAFGNSFDPAACNGKDTFGPGAFHLVPTGSLETCTNSYGAMDLSGNLWEHTLGGDTTTVRGGAFNCSDPVAFFKCDYVPGWTPTAIGFRCCLVPDSTDASLPEAGPSDAPQPEASPVDGESGCIEPEGAAPDGPSAEASDVMQDEAAQDVSAEDTALPDAHDASQDQGNPDSGPCPGDMAFIGSACMDLYEASHSDATATSAGSSAIAANHKGVLPWFPVDLPTARAACLAAGKRLCRLDEWIGNCHGPGATVYSYGDAYDPDRCNGIDAFCDCGGAQCSGLATCPYPHCFNQASTEGPGPCGASFHVAPTGSFPDCTSAYGVFDTNGNVWELGDSTDGLEHFRGGAFNCGDSEKLHKCDEDGTWNPSAKGFRCCMDVP